MTLTVATLGLPGEAQAWAGVSAMSESKSVAGADVVVGIPSALSTQRVSPGQILVALVAADSIADQRLLRRSRVDTIAALTRADQQEASAVPWDGNIADHTLDELVERARRKPRLAIGTAVRFVRRAELWGDTHFARDLGDAMRRLGWRTGVLTHPQASRLSADDADAFLHLHGLRPAPSAPVPQATWVISHPNELTERPAGNALLYSCSARHVANFGATLLHQATSPYRFAPQPRDPALAFDALFIANSRNQQRPVVTHALDAGIDISVFGRKWRRVYPSLTVAGQQVPNEDLARYYSSAKVVLNDHWADMVEHDIVSNRVFDALASGAVVLSDHVAAITSLFGDLVATFDGHDSFVEKHQHLLAMTDDHRHQHAQQASALIRSAHSFDHRAAVIDDDLRRLLP